MRKALFDLLALGLVLSIVAGCSSASAPAPTSAPAATAPAAAATATPTAVVMAPTEIPTETPAPAATATPTAAPTKTPAPAATPTAAASSADSDVLNKMKTIHAFSADFTTKQGGEEAKGKMLLSGKKMRMDIEALGVTMAILVDEEQQTAYMYNPQEKMAMMMSYDEGVTGQTPGEILDWETHVTAPPKLLGEETVDGKSCVVYQFTTAKATSKTWIDKATGFPIKFESTESGQTVSAHFTNIVIGSVDESLLALPPDTEIQDWSELMGGITTPEATDSTPAAVLESPTPVSGSPTTLSPEAIEGPVPAELKNNVKIPAGFSLVPDSGQAEENIDTDTFKATAKWTGNASMEQLEAFYSGLMAEGWDSGGVVLSDLTLELTYYQKNSDPVIQLDVSAELGDDGTLLTLTIANGEP